MEINQSNCNTVKWRSNKTVTFVQWVAQQSRCLNFSAYNTSFTMRFSLLFFFLTLMYTFRHIIMKNNTRNRWFKGTKKKKRRKNRDTIRALKGLNDVRKSLNKCIFWFMVEYKCLRTIAGKVRPHWHL